ncbi:MAG: PIG-L family deacetylase [Chthoniobacterales bacterium]|nr:PIG-L family deacetylase [Chthoniobacterales bacterium]
MEKKKTIALFLFAHQDGEFGVFQKITDEIVQKNEVYCAYLTNGSFGGVPPERRNQESLVVLSQLGVKKENIFFPGYDFLIPDGCLPEYLGVCLDWIKNWLSIHANLAVIYIPAWEGGHQDHDALHAITVDVADRLGILTQVWQFPLYNACHCLGPLFRVLHSLPENGKNNSVEISLQNLFRFLSYYLSYPSQFKKWRGLFPFVSFYYLINGTQILQPVSKKRIF